MTAFDANDTTQHSFNIYFWIANFMAIVVGSLMLYAVFFVYQEQQVMYVEQDDFVSSVERYLKYRTFQCTSNRYSNDLLLRKITNTDQALSENYVPETLVPVPAEFTHPRVGVQSVRSDILEPLVSMLDQARIDGLNLRLNSAYRSYTRQSEVYEKNADELITKPERAARPGYSEHQLGTAVDISLYPTNAQPGYDWLQENAHRYGFVLSYPDGAQDVTEFLYEPWHWRYVGLPIAEYIHTNNMLFNHEQALFLPSPLEEETELPYEYRGRDLWVGKTVGSNSSVEWIVSGWQEEQFFSDLSLLIGRFEAGVISNVSGSIDMPVRDWIVTTSSTTYTDRNNQEWIRTSLASPLDDQEIERLEVLYRDDFGYMVISYQTQDSGDRLAREFTYSCGIN